MFTKVAQYNLYLLKVLVELIQLTRDFIRLLKHNCSY